MNTPQDQNGQGDKDNFVLQPEPEKEQIQDTKMKDEWKAKEVAYNWFLRRAREGDLTTVGRFLYDRSLWDSMQRELVIIGENPSHDDVKELARRIDKGGFIGGVNFNLEFAEQKEVVRKRNINRKETGHPDGIDGIRQEVEGYSVIMKESRLAAYYEEPHWKQTSRDYRESMNWTCELCLKEHSPNSKSLVTHHLSYTLADGKTPAFFKETSRELMAACKSPCHQLADIARYMRVGRISQAQLDVALSPLFSSVRK